MPPAAAGTAAGAAAGDAGAVAGRLEAPVLGRADGRPVVAPLTGPELAWSGPGGTGAEVAASVVDGAGSVLGGTASLVVGAAVLLGAGSVVVGAGSVVEVLEGGAANAGPAEAAETIRPAIRAAIRPAISAVELRRSRRSTAERRPPAPDAVLPARSTCRVSTLPARS
jgi:hypothetical protein